VLHGDATPESDVDLIADFETTPGLKFFSIEEEMENILGRRVDLFTEGGIDKYLRSRIFQEARDVL
jgi:predicted nucleotidyltransferase